MTTDDETRNDATRTAPLAIVALALALASLAVAYLLPHTLTPWSWLLSIPAIVAGFIAGWGEQPIARAGIIVGIASVGIVAITLTM